MRLHSVCLLAALAACGWVSAGEVGTLETVGQHGLLFQQSADAQFVVQATATWGGYRDQLPRSLPTAVPLQAIPVGGFAHQAWDLASPYGDFWSARWTATLRIATAGEYTFYYTSDDGARMWLDDKQIINDWVPRSGLTSVAKVNLSVGDHPARCEFFEQGGGAQAHVEWSGPGIARQVIPASVTSAEGKPGWKAEYFLNMELRGDPTPDHTETIDFNWGDGGPAVFGAGPPTVTLDWARPTGDLVIGQLRGPQKAYAGLLAGALGRLPRAFQVWNNELVAVPTSEVGSRPVELRLRALNAKAAYAADNPADQPGVWAPGDEPLVFLAGFGELPNLDAATALRRLQHALSSGQNAPPPAVGADGWASLFNGKDLTGWQLRHADGVPSWKVENGVLVNTQKGTDLYSEVPLTDFELQAEFLVPPGSNSGVYLQGRYELQICDSFGQPPNTGTTGAIYSKIAPSASAEKPAGEWQTLDVRFRGARPSLEGGLASHARVTVILNGTCIINAADIDGITGLAMDGDECHAHGIMLQGDHGPIQYRNLKVRPVGANM